MNACNRAIRSGRASAQRGVVLIVALIVLVIMSFAGLLMFRATGTGVEVAGNIGFKQNATSMADLGVEQARAFLLTFKAAASAAALNADIPASGYHATRDDTFNPSTYDWNAANASVEAVALDAETGNRVRYVIHRLCKLAGELTAPNQECTVPDDGSALGSGGGGVGAGSGFKKGMQAYYRVTSRVDGPRGTVSYVQVIMF